MNERDSEEVLGMLTASGYAIAEAPEQADVILLNTCSVREHAEERAFGKMGELSTLKRDRPETKTLLAQRLEILGRAVVTRKLWEDDEGQKLLGSLSDAEAALATAQAELSLEERQAIGPRRRKLALALAVVVTLALVGLAAWYAMMR